MRTTASVTETKLNMRRHRAGSVFHTIVRSNKQPKRGQVQALKQRMGCGFGSGLDWLGRQPRYGT